MAIIPATISKTERMARLKRIKAVATALWINKSREKKLTCVDSTHSELETKTKKVCTNHFKLREDDMQCRKIK